MDLNVCATIKTITWINILGSIPHKKIYFIIYLLEDEHELSLGMLIRVQHIYNFFIVPCYYIIRFGCLIGIYMLFYIIFGTNLLIEGPVPVSVFTMF